MIFKAFCVAAIFFVFMALDFYLGSQVLERPLVISALVGLVLGDLQTGLIMGAALEGIYMGYSAIGGTIPGDPSAGSALAVAFAILTGSNMETALALSVPIASAMNLVTSLILSLSSLLAPTYEKLLKEGKDKTFSILHILQGAILMCLPICIIMFFSVAFGIEQIDKVLAILPPFVLKGLEVAGGMLPAVGFAILLNMTWSKDIGIFFFVGFVFSKYMKLPIVAITILALAIALASYSMNKNNGVVAVPEGDVEEDFFDE